ncbi:MAG: DUF1794, partial [uncultured Nocardioides sp.]
AVRAPRQPPPQLRPRRLAAGHLARQRTRRLPDDRGVRVPPGADLHPRRASLLPLHGAGRADRRARREGPRRRHRDRLPALPGAGPGRAAADPPHRLRRDLLRRGGGREARPDHRRGRPHRHRQGVRRRQAPLRQRRGRPALRRRHGRDGRAAPVAPVGAAQAGV